MSERIVQVRITGLVQGVGYRAWVEREALQRGLAGWVRNRRDGSVEAVFAGPGDVVEEMLAACHLGPQLATVADVEVAPVDRPQSPGFSVLPTE